MSDTEIFILARLIEEVDAAEPIPVTEHPCTDCKRTCGISPSSVKAIKEHGWAVRCQQCSEAKKPNIFAALPEAIKEMRINGMAQEAKTRRN